MGCADEISCTHSKKTEEWVVSLPHPSAVLLPSSPPTTSLALRVWVYMGTGFCPCQTSSRLSEKAVRIFRCCQTLFSLLDLCHHLVRSAPLVRTTQNTSQVSDRVCNMLHAVLTNATHSRYLVAHSSW